MKSLDKMSITTSINGVMMVVFSEYRSSEVGNHNDLYEIEEAGIEQKGLFFNADTGIDSKSLREFLESKEIITNIKPNPRNGK
ncbi:hypothetical protein [Capnocytophaga sputigena]|uniref:hypothetical protein n=1 Tax=Capnocytophaga sputigena TaxID=1019 RepID=UPI0028D4C428|nr:hypothetical protein [Capnocytophaga sputigena]